MNYLINGLFFKKEKYLFIYLNKNLINNGQILKSKRKKKEKNK